MSSSNSEHPGPLTSAGPQKINRLSNLEFWNPPCGLGEEGGGIHPKERHRRAVPKGEQGLRPGALVLSKCQL